MTGNKHSPDIDGENVQMCIHKHIIQLGNTYAALAGENKDTTPQPLQLSLAFGTKESLFLWIKHVIHAIQ